MKAQRSPEERRIPPCSGVCEGVREGGGERGRAYLREDASRRVDLDATLVHHRASFGLLRLPQALHEASGRGSSAASSASLHATPSPSSCSSSTPASFAALPPAAVLPMRVGHVARLRRRPPRRMGHIGLEITVKEQLDEGTSENAEYRYVATRPSARIYVSASHTWERRSGGSCSGRSCDQHHPVQQGIHPFPCPCFTVWCGQTTTVWGWGCGLRCGADELGCGPGEVWTVMSTQVTQFGSSIHPRIAAHSILSRTSTLLARVPRRRLPFVNSDTRIRPGGFEAWPHSNQRMIPTRYPDRCGSGSSDWVVRKRLWSNSNLTRAHAWPPLPHEWPPRRRRCACAPAWARYLRPAIECTRPCTSTTSSAQQHICCRVNYGTLPMTHLLSVDMRLSAGGGLTCTRQ